MPISKFLSPKNDVAFKKIFGTEKNKDILIHFLNDMLVFKEQKPITEVTFLKTVQDPDIAARKTSIVDILCKDEIGNSYVVEMQMAKSKGFEKRAQYYAAKAYIAQMNSGGQYHDLKEIIFLAIADFIMFPDKIKYKSDHVILDKETQEHDLKDFSFTFLELGKFNKSKNELNTMIEKWAYFFKHASDTSEAELQQIFANDQIIQRAYEELNRFSWNEDELRDYESLIKKDTDYQASMDQKYDEGLTEGEKRGIEKGKTEGTKQALLKVAKNLLQQGLSIQIIADSTGLSSQEIKNIQRQAK